MKFFFKTCVLFCCTFFCISLSACKKTIYYSEIKEGNVNIPISTLGVDFVLNLDSVPKYDVNTILPAPLKEGIEHKIVTDIQGKLMALGFMAEDKPTSYYGSSTTDAIKSFERQLGFEQDGICNLKLYKILMSSNAPSYVAMRHYSGEDIRLLQQQLYELCYLTDEANVNGYFGLRTENAVKEMQLRNGLPSTGIVDLKTYNYLYGEHVIAYTITESSRPDVITKYQQRLKDLGYYYYECDGKYSDLFRVAVRTYQHNNSQVADGYIGPSTKLSLDSKFAKPFAIFLGNNNQTVKNIQVRLTALKYIEPSAANGYYGEYTAQGVALFQKTNNLPVTGSVDVDTYLTINNIKALPSADGPINNPTKFILDTDELRRQLAEVSNIGSVEDLIRTAKLKLGSKYVWGKQGPDTFDCSGFVYWCLNQIGVNVNYMTTYNWRFCTQFDKVEKFEDLIPGDLIVVNGHMGIVAENETIIDASASSGKVVHRDLDDWWKDRFIMGFRILDNKKEVSEGI